MRTWREGRPDGIGRIRYGGRSISRGKRILLVDDEPESGRACSAAILSRRGLRLPWIVVRAGPREALAATATAAAGLARARLPTARPRRHDARHGRLRPARPRARAARVRPRARGVPHGEGRALRPRERPGPGRRRLPRQAIPPPGARAAHRRSAALLRRREPDARAGRLPRRLRRRPRWSAPMGDGAAHRQGARDIERARAQRRAHRHHRRLVRGVLGHVVRLRELAHGAHPPPAREDRGQPVEARLARHGAGGSATSS